MIWLAIAASGCHVLFPLEDDGPPGDAMPRSPLSASIQLAGPVFVDTPPIPVRLGFMGEPETVAHYGISAMLGSLGNPVGTTGLDTEGAGSASVMWTPPTSFGLEVLQVDASYEPDLESPFSVERTEKVLQVFGDRSLPGEDVVGGGEVIAVPVDIPSAGRIVGFGASLTAVATGEARFGLYRDLANAPDTLEVASAMVTLTEGDLEQTVDHEVSAPGRYWVALQASATFGVERAPGGESHSSMTSFGASMPSPFPTSTAEGFKYALYVTVGPM